ncbi:nucleic acid-binding protein [Phlegmacium glaucopus]|nr:nucleic acid-binding protein [Phlegmacium glaucopus]
MPPMAFNGIVTKAGFMNKTATVTVSRQIIHKLTGKQIERSKKYLVHDEHNVLRQHDIVVIRNCPPISAMKRFKLEKILKSPETEHDLVRARRAQHGMPSSGLPQGSVLQAIKSS